ncbi:hypothetical protein EYF80_019127 [Liparis tanakae]|uniref:Uncharacterized protein n=1 Tax=Liparis tanakae TaxID=230148 RepID=A0A4Z2HYS7_9TELE|nr:hypothetical protein EYF80_019127 [Liparis tanakae]
MSLQQQQQQQQQQQRHQQQQQQQHQQRCSASLPRRSLLWQHCPCIPMSCMQETANDTEEDNNVAFDSEYQQEYSCPRGFLCIASGLMAWSVQDILIRYLGNPVGNRFIKPIQHDI